MNPEPSRALDFAACAVEVLRGAEKLVAALDPRASGWLAAEAIGAACNRFLAAKLSREREAAAVEVES